MKVTVGDKVVYSSIQPLRKKAGRSAKGNGNGTTTCCGNRATIRIACAIVGDPTWTDFTYTLKARKLSGDEGFLVLFHCATTGIGFGGTSAVGEILTPLFSGRKGAWTSVNRPSAGSDRGAESLVRRQNRNRGARIRCYLMANSWPSAATFPHREAADRASKGHRSDLRHCDARRRQR